MKRNRESKSRIKIIQQLNMNKQQQNNLDLTAKKYELAYFIWYEAITGSRDALNTIINKMMSVEMVNSLGRGQCCFFGDIGDYEFLLKDNKPYWIGVDLSKGRDCSRRITLCKQ